MKRIGWSFPCLSSFKTAKRRGLRNQSRRSEVLEVRTLMSATTPELVAGDPNETLPVEGPVESNDSDSEILTLQSFGVTPPAITNFTSREEFGEYLLERALERYEGLFGQPQWWYHGPVYLRGGEFMALAAMSDSVDHSETNVQVDGVDEGDLIENDGKHLFGSNGNDLIIMQAYPADQMQELSRIRFEGYAIAEYLDGDRLTVISQEYNYGGVGGGLAVGK